MKIRTESDTLGYVAFRIEAETPEDRTFLAAFAQQVDGEGRKIWKHSHLTKFDNGAGVDSVYVGSVEVKDGEGEW